MAILHGNWLSQSQGGYLFLWGETWRRMTEADYPQAPDVTQNPYAMAATELSDWLAAGCPGSGMSRGTCEILLKHGKPSHQLMALPTHLSDTATTLMPQYSAASLTAAANPVILYLYPWEIEGLCLAPLAALQFLQTLPLGTVASGDSSLLGSDLRFWSHVARWCLDLLARCKFLPALESSVPLATEKTAKTTALAQWHPLLDSAVDRVRLERFTQQMPFACRVYQERVELAENPQTPEKNPPPDAPLAIQLPLNPKELLRSFLKDTVDAQVRQQMQAHPLDKKVAASFPAAVRQWLRGLAETTALPLDPPEAAQLEATLDTWKSPLQHSLKEQSLFRTCFRLHPPLTGSRDWILQYCLQAVDKPDVLVDANTIWNHPYEELCYKGRTIYLPQETLLSGLGLASKLYPLIEPSLQERSPQSCRLTPQQVHEFITSCTWRFTDSGLGVVLPESLANREGAARLGLRISAQTPKLKKTDRLGLQSLLSFKWELSLGGHTINKTQFDRLVAQKSPLVEIDDQWLELRPSDVRAAQMFFDSRKEQMSLTLEDALRLAAGDTQTIEKLPVVSFEAGGQLQELLDILTNNRSLETLAAPKALRGELRPYQARGMSWLTFLERWGLGACLADDMGLGKTIETIAFLLHLQEQGALYAPILLVCPTSVLGNWEREIKKFGPTLRAMVHHGNNRLRSNAFMAAIRDKNLVITSYALLYRDEKTLKSVQWRGVILDEAQNIKNPEAKQSQVVRQLNTQFRLALTGTPVENRLSELWSILDFLNPGYLGQRAFFQRRFAIPIEKYGDTDSLKTLRSLVQPFILRRLKTDKDIIQDLPEKQEMTVFCPLSTEQAALYQKLVEESLAEIEAAQGIQRHGMVLALLIKLKQVCNHPLLLKSEAQLMPGSEVKLQGSASGKLQRLEEMLEEVLSEGDRALIFTQFAEWGKLLKSHLEQRLSREILFLYGGTRKTQREDMIDQFQNDPQGPPILILSLKAGGTGLNLTRANHVFHFDRWWNPAVENQATDRAFRIGQTRNVQVHKFVCTGTLEEKIHDLIEGKKALAEQVVSAGEQWLTELDTDQLRNLLILDRSAVIDEE